MTARPRASTTRAAFSRALTPAPPAADTTPKPRGRTDERSKYTLLLDPDPAADFDDLAARLRRQLRRKVNKSEIIRAWISLTADDPALLTTLAQEIQARHDGTTA